MSMVVGNAKSVWKANGRWEKVASETYKKLVHPALETNVHYGFETANTDNERLSQSISLQY